MKTSSVPGLSSFSRAKAAAEARGRAQALDPPRARVGGASRELDQPLGPEVVARLRGPPEHHQRRDERGSRRRAPRGAAHGRPTREPRREHATSATCDDVVARPPQRGRAGDHDGEDERDRRRAARRLGPPRVRRRARRSATKNAVKKPIAASGSGDPDDADAVLDRLIEGHPVHREGQREEVVEQARQRLVQVQRRALVAGRSRPPGPLPGQWMPSDGMSTLMSGQRGLWNAR